jgi:hypothetical protein
MKKINSLDELRGLMLSLGAKEDKLDGFTFLELDCGPGSKIKNEVNEREEKMKKYKVSNSELGYEQIIMAENEQDAEIDGLVHCKEYLQEYINIDVEEVIE